jgi:hypothetical protein
MLRALVAVLLLANALLFAWSQGWLDGVAGVKPHGDREPGRLARQVKPESVRVLSPAVVQTAMAASASAAAQTEAAASNSASGLCLEAGPFVGAAEQRAAAEEIRRAALPPGAVASAPVTRPGVFIVYMGKYPSPEALQRKTEELKRRNVDYEVLRNVPWLEPGLALGRFSDRPAAEAKLATLADRDVHTAKVLALTPPATGHVWRAERADAELAAKLTAWKAKALGAGFAPCASTEPAPR